MKLNLIALDTHKKTILKQVARFFVTFVGIFILLRVAMVLLRLLESRFGSSELVFILFLHLFVWLVGSWSMSVCVTLLKVKIKVMQKSLQTVGVSLVAWQLIGAVLLRIFGPTLLQIGAGSFSLLLLGLLISIVLTARNFGRSGLSSAGIVMCSLGMCVPLYWLFIWLVGFTI